jgi:CMP-N-acetylneuraminic acid synthetase
MNRIAIIPARGGSKRIIGKNLYNLCGLPLIAHTTQQAIEWGNFDKIYVNSDSNEILELAKKYGAIPYKRPEELAIDTAKVLDVIKEQIVSMQLDESDELVLLLPTCPLRNSDDIDSAYNIFIENKKQKQVVSVAEYEKAPEQSFIIRNGVLTRQFPDGYSSRSQDHFASYRYNTAIIISTVKIFMHQEDIVGIDSIPYIMPFERSIDIDYQYQMSLVELIMKANNKYSESIV